MELVPLSKYTERKRLLLVQVNADHREEGVIITIPVNTPIATNKSERDFFEKNPSNNGLWRWAAGGIGIIAQLYDAKVLLTLHRCEGAPSYQYHNTVSSGLSCSVKELFYPLVTAWRQALEELCIVTLDRIICPIPVTDHFGISFEFSDLARSTANLFPELAKKKLLKVKSPFHPLRGERKLTVTSGDESVTTEGLIVFDEGVKGIDILKAIVVPVPCTLAELTVYDGETTGNGHPLNRRVNALLLDENFKPTGKMVASWVRGERVSIDPKSAPQTPVFKALCDAL